MTTNNILGIIPARGGSKGIKDKNIIDLCGKPLISWSIKTGAELLKNATLKKCIVSTDDQEIAKIAEEHGGDVPFFRPKKISTDKSKSIEFVLHALEELKKKGMTYNAVMILQPTSPQRNSEDISKIVNSFMLRKENSLISCYQEDYINEYVMYNKVGETLQPVSVNHNKGIRRQTHSPIYIRNGALYVTKVPFILKNKKLVCDNPMLLEMKKTKSINLDNLEDLKLLRKILCK